MLDNASVTVGTSRTVYREGHHRTLRGSRLFSHDEAHGRRHLVQCDGRGPTPTPSRPAEGLADVLCTDPAVEARVVPLLDTQTPTRPTPGTPGFCQGVRDDFFPLRPAGPTARPGPRHEPDDSGGVPERA
jgi:hypothetical protein